MFSPVSIKISVVIQGPNTFCWCVTSRLKMLEKSVLCPGTLSRPPTWRWKVHPVLHVLLTKAASSASFQISFFSNLRTSSFHCKTSARPNRPGETPRDPWMHGFLASLQRDLVQRKTGAGVFGPDGDPGWRLLPQTTDPPGGCGGWGQLQYWGWGAHIQSEADGWR